MKKILPLFLLVFISGCATIGPAPDPYVGAWDYELFNLPQGIPTGTITITGADGDYMIQSENTRGVVEWNDVAIEDGELVSAHFDYNGTRVDVRGTFEDDTLNGNMSAQGYTFRLEAKKQGSE